MRCSEVAYVVQTTLRCRKTATVSRSDLWLSHHCRVDGLVNAVSELVASVLRRIGVVGQSRRRSVITSDLELLALLAQTEGFGIDSQPHQELQSHIEAEVRAYTGGRKEWRKREWFTVVFAALLGVGFGYAAYRASAVAWWLAVIAWIPAAVFGLTSFVALVSPPEPKQEAESQGVQDPSDKITPGDSFRADSANNLPVADQADTAKTVSEVLGRHDSNAVDRGG
jgi:hypothetical protein